VSWSSPSPVWGGRGIGVERKCSGLNGHMGCDGYRGDKVNVVVTAITVVTVITFIMFVTVHMLFVTVYRNKI
jgi:hypothetical protein